MQWGEFNSGRVQGAKGVECTMASVGMKEVIWSCRKIREINRKK